MDFKEIEQLIGERLVQSEFVRDRFIVLIQEIEGRDIAVRQPPVSIDVPIAWPNKDYDGTVPYIEFRHVPVERVDPVISGGYAYQRGIVLLTIVVPRDVFSGDAWDIAQTISDVFPKALRLRGSTGNVVISAPANPGTGFVDGTYWRQPISISYITES
ncbi:Protein of unknown function DUF4128 [uncultured Caudovirales phage]|uniref:Tail completion protein n=1 Tax=uncultured Caudovirales phage TaxID=2100421 RepID=A0A6J5LSD0_9CAUD|nr:Protein of unknown function DUF4128 [uncultured Caudovirales phage]